MTRTVIVPLDGSLHSHAILGQLGRLFEPDEIRLVLLTVAEPSAVVVGTAANQDMDPLAVVASFAPATVSALAKGSWGEKGEYAYRKAHKQLTRYLEDKAGGLRSRGFEVETDVRFGSPARTIIDCAKELDADAIAMTTHGRTGVARLVFGSVAAAVLKSGVAPVVLFRPQHLQKTSEMEEEQ